MSDYENKALFEHRFWLQVLGDHARFIFSALAPNEIETIQQAQYFITIMDSLLSRARQNLTAPEVMVLSREAYESALQIRELKLELIRRHLAGKIKIGLTPTFINHMVNEVEEYIRILNYLIQEDTPPLINPVHYHLLWLLDAEGHAVMISADLDSTEKNLIEMSDAYMRLFRDYYSRAHEFSGYMRTSLMDFPALERLNQQVSEDMKRFKEFLGQLETLILTKQALGRLTPLAPDHMAREECYYLTKLSHVAQTPKPDCDPTKPRTIG